jgi:hypothetical protein
LAVINTYSGSFKYPIDSEDPGRFGLPLGEFQEIEQLNVCGGSIRIGLQVVVDQLRNDSLPPRWRKGDKSSRQKDSDVVVTHSKAISPFREQWPQRLKAIMPPCSRKAPLVKRRC